MRVDFRDWFWTLLSCSLLLGGCGGRAVESPAAAPMAPTEQAAPQPGENYLTIEDAERALEQANQELQAPAFAQPPPASAGAAPQADEARKSEAEPSSQAPA